MTEQDRIDYLKVNGVDILESSVPYRTSIEDTTKDIADKINKRSPYKAKANGTLLTIKPLSKWGKLWRWIRNLFT